MHFFLPLVLILGFCLLVIVGLLSVFQSLMERDFHAAPVVTEGDSPGEHRYPAANSPSAPPAADIERPFRMSGGQRG